MLAVEHGWEWGRTRDCKRGPGFWCLLNSNSASRSSFLQLVSRGHIWSASLLAPPPRFTWNLVLLRWIKCHYICFCELFQQKLQHQCLTWNVCKTVCPLWAIYSCLLKGLINAFRLLLVCFLCMELQNWQVSKYKVKIPVLIFCKRSVCVHCSILEL